MRKISTLVLPFLAFACSSQPQKSDPPPAQPPEAAPTLWQVTDGSLWLLPSSQNTAVLSEIQKHSKGIGEWDLSTKLPDLVGQEREFAYFQERSGLLLAPIDVKASGASYYNLPVTNAKSRKLRMKKLGDCHGYPESAVRVSIKSAAGKSLGSGYLLPKGSELHSHPSKEFAEAYNLFRKTHLAFIEQTYPKEFPDYGQTIDQNTVAIRTPKGAIFFMGPSPAIKEDKHPVYLFRHGSNAIESIELPAQVSCAT